VWVAALATVAFGATLTFAFQVRQKASRFDALVVENPSQSLDGTTASVDSLPTTNPLRAGWDAFRAQNNQKWAVHLDRRSGAPMLVEGRGIAWVPGGGNNLVKAGPVTLDSLESLVRAFATNHRTLLMANNSELVLNREGSGPIGDNMWQVIFDRRVGGIPVQGDRYLFAISHGNLVQFGATRWAPINTSPIPDIDSRAALDRVYAYMGIGATDNVKVMHGGSLEFVPLPSNGSPETLYTGAIGGGYSSALVWRVSVAVEGEPGSWVALVNAHSGQILSFVDENQYAQAKGGVYPVSNDGAIPDGVEAAGYPMPFANITIGASTQITGSVGAFNCAPGGSTATTTLNGQYVKVNDTCGAISVSTTCDTDLNLGVSGGTDCIVPPGTSAGDTHAARSSFYHLNRIAEHGRAWLPGNAWLNAQLTNNVNLTQTCNAYWSPGAGTVNFFRSGGGCANTGELAGVFLHEWGHGFDQNDGGGTDNPGEAYGDVTALMATHVSCIGRGFEPGVNCSGYGNACLNCTGIRDTDWAKRVNNIPTTATQVATCSGGSGPCGREVHCEGYLAAETIWDLAVRDLPASGLDVATSWQLADKLWYKSRAGSGGNAYTCSGTTSDGCAATSWFSKLRVQDDDDGNLANGTPHAAAIYAAFNRHRIACGNAADASNQNSSSCPAIAAPTLTATAGSSSVVLNWTAVPNANSYRILRNDLGCDQGSTIVATVAAPSTNYTDTGLANGFAEYYHVQAVGVNPACDGVLSACKTGTPQPFAGTVKFDATSYSCAGSITITVTDANIPGTTTTVNVTSTSEPSGEIITLTQTPLGSANYIGSIATTASAPGADGQISVANGDTITGTYIDADDGVGGVNVVRTTTAGADCVTPIITSVTASNFTGHSARITWTTDELSDSTVDYGLAPPPGSTVSVPAPRVLHSVDLDGLAQCTNYVYAVHSADAVGNRADDNNGGTYYTFTTFKESTFSFNSTDTPIAIPDNNSTGITSTLTVAEVTPKTVIDVDVKLNLTHTFDGDLIIYLITPTNVQIRLHNRFGGTGENFTNTVFDDEAATPISAGTPPYTGSFRPDQPLTAADGISSNGAWKLKVVDLAGVDVGTLDNWTLTLTYPAQACGSHATVLSSSSLADTCSTGGGGGNGLWEAGETINVDVTVYNDGSGPLTGVTATLTSPTPGVTFPVGTAAYPVINEGASLGSTAPHFSVKIPTSQACNSTISFNVAITANEGAWSGAFTRGVGQDVPPNGTLLNENFGGGIPATWAIVDGGSGGGAAATWTTANPGSRTFTAPLSSPVAIVDSDNAGTSATQDEQLITPVLAAPAAASSVTLEFDQYYRYYNLGLAEHADVDIRSSATGGAWVNLLAQTTTSSATNDHKTIDISSYALGATNLQVRFHYYSGQYEWWWQIDNVKVSYIAPAGCINNVCAAPPTVVKPVADGSYGTAMTGSRVDAAGTQIDVTWDVSTCSSTNHHILYGDLATVSSYAIGGSACLIGTSGSYGWSGVPAGDLWFVVAGDDGTSTEGSLGTGVGGAERGGLSASGQCGMSTKDISGSCP
jgi:subtilisin-like proprotein convertase family protein